MMFLLQYGGAAFIIGGYFYLTKSVRVSALVSFVGCVLCGIWAYNMDAWGILAIEVMCSGLSLRNAWKGS